MLLLNIQLMDKKLPMKYYKGDGNERIELRTNAGYDAQKSRISLID